MKILATADIHQMISKWKSLINACNIHKPDVVAISGDICPKDTYIVGQLPFIKHLRKYAEKIRFAGSKLVLILGNDDNQLLIPELEKMHNDGLLYYIPEKVVEIYGYEFAAMPYVPDYPFGYKFWCRGEFRDNLRIDEQQFADPVVLNKNNEFEIIKDYYQYLKSNKTIWDCFVDTAEKVKDISKSIWLIHCPPANMSLDVCAHGGKVGSNAVYKFIQQYQPLLTLHGHIHESPEHNGHKWEHKEGKTTCIQPGQVGFNIHYVLVDIQDGFVVKTEHSIYG